jgi:hypothetical protein
VSSTDAGLCDLERSPPHLQQVAFTDEISGAVFNGSFDFPFCGLPESGPVMCCPE